MSHCSQHDQLLLHTFGFVQTPVSSSGLHVKADVDTRIARDDIRQRDHSQERKVAQNLLFEELYEPHPLVEVRLVLRFLDQCVQSWDSCAVVAEVVRP